MIDFVIDPQDNGDCYGKYRRSEENIPDDWENVVDVDDFSNYTVVEWRYGL